MVTNILFETLKAPLVYSSSEELVIFGPEKVSRIRRMEASLHPPTV